MRGAIKSNPMSLDNPPQPSLIAIFLISLRLRCTSFGGPVAHPACFRKEYVEQKRWLDETHYADLAALCQFLPGPAGSQTGFGVGYFEPRPQTRRCSRARQQATMTP